MSNFLDRAQRLRQCDNGTGRDAERGATAYAAGHQASRATCPTCLRCADPHATAAGRPAKNGSTMRRRSSRYRLRARPRHSAASDDKATTPAQNTKSLSCTGFP
jgi:hypothetical protein